MLLVNRDDLGGFEPLHRRGKDADHVYVFPLGSYLSR